MPADNVTADSAATALRNTQYPCQSSADNSSANWPCIDAAQHFPQRAKINTSPVVTFQCAFNKNRTYARHAASLHSVVRQQL